MLFDTRGLAVYAATVGTIGGLWTLYSGVALDRARVALSVAEGEVISTAGSESRVPILMVRVSNRGRRAFSIQTIGRVVSMRRHQGPHELSADIMRQLTPPILLGEGEGRTFTHGERGGYEHGQMPLTRWYVIDGAGRTYPISERWRQRIERVLFWPYRWIGRRRDSRAS
ncbi:MAG: hypothetical protein E6G12_03800 [Actinobacteria bacterium]|nr:MAG: hypothetical protein E6G12_03800 [Actinomycetota bacterium]